MAEANSRIATLLAAEAADYGGSERNVARAFDGRRELFRRLIDEHGGREGVAAGASLVTEFRNALDAARCAVALQRAFRAENTLLPADEHVQLRIALHVAEVAADDGLRGEGVEIVRRLASLAAPSGICLTSAVYEQIKHRIHVAVEFAGERQLDHSREAFAIYRVVEPTADPSNDSLWTELKRRNVFRVGAAYAVVSWLLLQVASIVLPAFDAPRWLLQTAIALGIVGFPIALALAWIYELTPMGLRVSDRASLQSGVDKLASRRLDRAIIGLLVVALAVVIFDNYAPRRTESAVNGPKSIAVLAFRNQSADPTDEYFADGLAEELLTALSRIPELKVASRTASFYYKGKENDVSISTIAATLMVDNVLSGSVRRDGDRIRVTVALDDPAKGDLLWSDAYERSVEDILEIQRDIAERVAMAIVPVLSPESQAQVRALPTESSEAYDFYLRGRDYLRQPSEETAFRSAVALFGRAIELDPRFAQAYAGLCEAELSRFNLSHATEYFEQAEAACRRALALDERVWETHVALGNLYRVNGQYSRAVAELETAVERQPNAVDSYLALALAYEAEGSIDKAEATFRRAKQIESGFWGVYRAFGNFLYRDSRPNEAIDNYVKVTELAPESEIGYNNLGNLYLSLGRFDEAEQALNAVPQHTRYTYANRGLVYYYRGDFARAADDFRRATEVAPDYFANWGRLADANRFIDGAEEEARNDYEVAIRLAERDLTINPSDYATLGRLATYLVHTERPERARELVERLLGMSSDGDAYYYATLVYTELGDVARVAEYLGKAIEGGWTPALLAGDPDLARLHDDSRIARLLGLR